jgi:prepilin-type N-terminal cleavage/methylation domain-containing protein
MIKNILKIRNWKLEIRNFQAGMTYVELIVVLSIFAIMSAVVMFNYQGFQAKVDIKNLASDIALKIVEAQKSSLNGVLPSQTYSDTWKPSYGVYFDSSNIPDAPTDDVEHRRKFIYFTDLDQVGDYDTGGFCPTIGLDECIDKITISKGDYISAIDKCSGPTCASNSVSPLAITFQRPDSSAIFYYNGAKLDPASDYFEYIQITVKSAHVNDVTAKIKIYPSGRVQVN